MPPLFSQTAEILSGNCQYSQYSTYDHGENINFRIQVKNTGSTPLDGLWLNVSINYQCTNCNIYHHDFATRSRKWIDLPKLNPNQSYETGYKVLWHVPENGVSGIGTAYVELRDSSKVYDHGQVGSFMIH